MITFYVFATLAVLSALVVIGQRQAVFSALALIVCFASMAVLFFQLGAQFIGLIQVIVYAGAIMVLFLFVIMLLDPQSEIFPRNRLKRLFFLGVPVALVFGLLLIGTLIEAPAAQGSPFIENTKVIAQKLFRDYLLPFELTSILILIAVMGAVVLSKRPE